MPTRVYPARSQLARDVAAARASCTSSTSQPSRTCAASRDEPLGLAVVDERAARLPVAHLRLERVELVRRARTAGSRRRGRTALRARRAGRPCRKSTSSPCAAAFSRASASASGEMSVAVHARIRALLRERERDRAAARADVDDARRLGAVEQREAPLDDDLGLGARHERARVGLQRQPAEVPVAEDVGERLAPAAALRRARAPPRARLRSAAGRAGCRARSASARARARAAARRRGAGSRRRARRGTRSRRASTSPSVTPRARGGARRR